MRRLFVILLHCCVTHACVDVVHTYVHTRFKIIVLDRYWNAMSFNLIRLIINSDCVGNRNCPRTYTNDRIKHNNVFLIQFFTSLWSQIPKLLSFFSCFVSLWSLKCVIKCVSLISNRNKNGRRRKITIGRLYYQTKVLYDVMANTLNGMAVVQSSTISTNLFTFSFWEKNMSLIG